MKEIIKTEIKKRMELMKIDRKYIRNVLNGDVAIFERQSNIFSDVHYSLRLNETEEPYTTIKLKVEELRLKYQSYVYMAQITYTEFGRLCSLFFVNGKEEARDEWEYDEEDLKSNYAFVYVLNLDNEDLSEFGTITWKKGNMGGIIRTA